MNSLPHLFVIVYCLTTAVHASEPLVVAHRGLLHNAPENTLSNFRAYLELRIGFEFDVEVTKDGELVCIHDSTLDRTTNGTGKVSDHTLAQIRNLDAGSWFDPKFANEKVPTIDEVLKLVAEYKDYNVLIAVDLKAENVGQDVVRLAKKHKVLHRLLFIGRTISEPEVRERIVAASSKANTATVANNSQGFSDALAARNSNCVYFRYLPSKSQMDLVREKGKRAFIAGSTVSGNVPENWKHVVDVGIDGVLTDYPLELAVILRKPRSEGTIMQ